MFLARLADNAPLQIIEIQMPSQFYVDEDKEYYTPRSFKFEGGVASLDESPERAVRRLETFVDMEQRRVRMQQHPTFSNRRLTT